MVRDYRYIDKGSMEGNQFVTTIDPDTLSYKYERKDTDAVKIIKEKKTI